MFEIRMYLLNSALVCLQLVQFVTMTPTAEDCLVRCPRADYSYCCNVTNILPMLPEPQCRIPFLKDLINGRGVIPGPCLVECHMKHKGIIVNGSLHLDKVSKGWRQFYEKCERSVKGRTLNLPAYSGCSSFPYLLKICAERELILTCPSDKWRKSDWCEIIKNKAVNCSSTSLFYG